MPTNHTGRKYEEECPPTTLVENTGNNASRPYVVLLPVGPAMKTATAIPGPPTEQP